MRRMVALLSVVATLVTLVGFASPTPAEACFTCVRQLTCIGYDECYYLESCGQIISCCRGGFATCEITYGTCDLGAKCLWVSLPGAESNTIPLFEGLDGGEAVTLAEAPLCEA